MRARTNRHPFWKLAVLAAALGACAPAWAGPIQLRDGNGGNVFNGGPGAVNLTIKVGGASHTVSAGAFALEFRNAAADGWTAFLTYCLEPDETLGISGTTPRDGQLVTALGATSEYAPMGAALTGLYNTWFADSLTSATKSAAFQVALWETAFDTGGSLAAGLFQVVGASAAATQAETYLNRAFWVAFGAPVGVVLRSGNQDLIFQVSEPGGMTLFAGSLLVLAVLLVRRRLAARMRTSMRLRKAHDAGGLL